MEKDLIEKAKNCNKCLDWLDVCEAVCCRHIRLKRDLFPEIIPIEGKFEYRLILPPTQQTYYKLHRFKYVHGKVIIDMSKYRIVDMQNGFVHFYRDCDFLTDNKCRNNDRKPWICKDYDELGIRNKDKYYVPEKCLINFKGEKR